MSNLFMLLHKNVKFMLSIEDTTNKNDKDFRKQQTFFFKIKYTSNRNLLLNG